MSASNNSFDFDVVVIGGGSAGYAAARTGVAEGLKVAVVEGGREVGGLCILRGCMPTKALLHSSEVLHHAKHSQSFGVRSGEITFDFTAIMQRKDRLIKEFADYRVQQLTSGKFQFIRANAAFTSPQTIRLSTGETISSKHFILATGSVVACCPLKQLEEIGYITSDDALVLEKLPRSLIVLGGGAVAVEFAQFFCRLGVRVTLVQRSEHILKEEETEAAIELEKIFRREEMTVFTGTHLTHAWKEEGLKGVTFEYEGQPVRIAAEEILFALGRSPNTEGLNLDKAGVQMSYGRFPANSQMQTSAPHIYAAGDCTGLHDIVHIAVQQGELAAWNIAHPTAKKTMDYRLASSVIFTEPQLGRVGLTESVAKMEKIPYLVASHPFYDHGKSMILDALDGFVKLIADPNTGEIIGGTCLGPSGGELIHEIIAAMYKRMTVHELAAMPHYHPTLAEIWTYPAEELAGKISQR